MASEFSKTMLKPKPGMKKQQLKAMLQPNSVLVGCTRMASEFSKTMLKPKPGMKKQQLKAMMTQFQPCAGYGNLVTKPVKQDITFNNCIFVCCVFLLGSFRIRKFCSARFPLTPPFFRHLPFFLVFINCFGDFTFSSCLFGITSLTETNWSEQIDVTLE